ncbi:MAG: response regulator transcription factor [Pseudomonadota bacterium]
MFPADVEAGEAQRARLAVFDQNPVLASGLCEMLNQSGLFLCRAFPLTEAALVAAAGEHGCDVILVDPMQFGKGIPELGGLIHTGSPAVKVIAYSFEEKPEYLGEVIASGFSGCISKSAKPEEIALAVQSVTAGGLLTISGRYQREIVGLISEAPEATMAWSEDLSGREAQVLKAYAFGQSLKQISNDMQISPKTVNTYKGRAAKKLGLTDRASIVEYVLGSSGSAAGAGTRPR